MTGGTDQMENEISGRRLVWRFFAGLWVATLLALGYLGFVAGERFGDEVAPRLWVALVVDLMLPFVAWQIFRAMPRNRHLRQS